MINIKLKINKKVLKKKYHNNNRSIKKKDHLDIHKKFYKKYIINYQGLQISYNNKFTKVKINIKPIVKKIKLGKLVN